MGMWHEVRAKDVSKAWRLRHAVKQRKFAVQMVITSAVHTLLKVSTNKASHLQSFANEFGHSYKTAQGRPPNTITSHCGWIIDSRFKAEHEAVCQECEEAVSSNDVKAKKAIATNNEANRINRGNMEAEVETSVVKERGADVVKRTPVEAKKEVAMDIALHGDDYDSMTLEELEEKEEYHFTQYSKLEEIIKQRKADKAHMAEEIQRVTQEIQERKKLEFDTELDNKIREITAKYGGV